MFSGDLIMPMVVGAAGGKVKIDIKGEYLPRRPPRSRRGKKKRWDICDE